MDTSNLYLFTGENTYALSKELVRWKQRFVSKYGPENLTILRAKDASLSDLLDAVATMPFIAEKRLVVLEGIPRLEKEDLPRLLEEIHPQTVLVLVEAKPDKRLGITKEIERTFEKKYFPPLSRAELSVWIRSTVRGHGMSISPEAEGLLLSIVGDDQWMLQMELEKIVAGSVSEIGPEQVEALAVPSGSQVIWMLTDLVGSRKANEALLFLQRRIERGEEPYGLWTILLSMIKNLTLVFSALEAGHRDERSIATATGLYFLIVRGLLPLARSMDLSRVHALVDWVSAADRDLKTGGYHASADHPEEVIALTERAILMCG